MLSSVWRILARYIMWVVLVVVLLVFGGVNLLARNEPSEDLGAQIGVLRDLGRFAAAEELYERLLAERPLDLALHQGYISNHFDIPQGKGRQARDDTKILAHYEALAAQPESADIGHYGLGLIHALRQEYPAALEEYWRVANRDQGNLDNSIGQVYLHLGDPDAAEEHFWREMELGGNVGGAVGNLVRLYLERGDMQGMRALLENPRARGYISLSAWRVFAFRTGQVGRYLRLVFLAPLEEIGFQAGVTALMICAMWFIYFWRIDVFEQEPLAMALRALLLGALAALCSFILSDALGVLSPLQMGKGWLGDLAYSVIHIGVVEELVKFLPVLGIVLLTKEVNEPLDMLIYGSLSALGFATLENALYFSGLGLGIVFDRFLLSTVGHMTDTSLVLYLWARARHQGAGKELAAVVGGLGLAAVVHGLYDFFLIGALYSPGTSFALSLLMAFLWGRMLRSCLKRSPFFDFDRSLSASNRLRNYQLLLSGALIALLIAYLRNNADYSTDTANLLLLMNGWRAVIGVLVTFGALGELGLRSAAT